MACPVLRAAYVEETKCTSILDKIVVQGYKALQLQYFFTAGEDEVRQLEKHLQAPVLTSTNICSHLHTPHLHTSTPPQLQTHCFSTPR